LKKYDPRMLRTVSVIGHGSVGKTSLCDALVYQAGDVERLGRVDDGSSFFDYTGESRERKHSLSFSQGICNWKDNRITVLDTPGLADFYGETIGSVAVSDGAVLVLDATSGVEVGSLKTWSFAREAGVPVFLWVNKLDGENVDFNKLLGEARESLHQHILPMVFPAPTAGRAEALVNVITGSAVDMQGNETEIPQSAADTYDRLRRELLESAAETSESLMESYFENDDLTTEQMEQGIRQAMSSGDLFPLLCGTSVPPAGQAFLLDALVSLMPSPLERAPEKAVDPEGNEVEVEPDPDGPFTARVFSTKIDKHVGELVYVRVLRGSLEGAADVYNTEKSQSERLNSYYIMSGGKRMETDRLVTGDIAAVAKLKDTSTNETLCDRRNPVSLLPIGFPEPVHRAAIQPKSRGDEDRMGTGLAKLSAQDPTYVVRNEPEIGQTTVAAMGEQHHSVMLQRLKELTGVEATLSKPRIAYHETITKQAKNRYRHKKQTGGRGQYGEVYLRLEPLKRGEGFVFESEVVGGAVPTKFIPAVEKGVREALGQGPLSGSKVVDIKAVAYDGSSHPVDSSDMAFKIAANRCFQEAMAQANPIVLEPIMDLVITVPEEFMGDVMGDINSRRGKIQGMESEGSFQVLSVKAPEAELYQYTSTLRSLTQARGSFSQSFSHYEQVPREVQQKIFEEYQKSKHEEG
jgi:elongation factor G